MRQIDARSVRHGRYAEFQRGAWSMPEPLFADILRRSIAYGQDRSGSRSGWQK
jgi:hypothetical protein